MKIQGTFLDEISHDIPHQNWDESDWDNDFAAMKKVGINTVILIRSGHKRWMTFNSEVLQEAVGGYPVETDLLQMFLNLSEKHGMKFFCGTYDSGNYPWQENYQLQTEVELMRRVNQEIWDKYGKSPAFGGWYLSQEIATGNDSAMQSYRQLAKYLKEISGNLPIMISPGMLGAKAYDKDMNKLGKTIQPEEHRRMWDENMRKIQGYIDIVAFQDGHVEFDELPTFLKINKELCDLYHIECWTNSESFDRDMPIDFLPIKWEKLRLKLEAARAAGIENAITFEFSHFMSPNSAYFQAHGLYKHYQRYYLNQIQGENQ